VLDGDALWFVSKTPDLVKGRSNVILTPNEMEYRRIAAAVFDMDLETAGREISPGRLARELGGVTVLRKGNEDVISNGDFRAVLSDTRGSYRRVGGQGDITAGIVGTFMAWESTAGESQPLAPLIACYAACAITKLSNLRAFSTNGRSTITSDILAALPSVISDIDSGKLLIECMCQRFDCD